jgi:hypothetical protein
MRVSTLGLTTGFAIVATATANTAPIAVISPPAFRIAQAVAQTMAPSAGAADADRSDTAEQRMRRRFPQPVRVGDLIGLPLLDDGSRILGLVRQVVRTPQHKIELIVAYDGWFGWGARPVAVPIEVVGIQGRELASLDMPRAEYTAASTWQQTNETAIPYDDSISVALARP